MTDATPQVVSELCNAAWMGDIEKVKTLLKILPPSTVNTPGPKGTNALYCAARSEQSPAEVCLELLNFPGIDLNIQAAQHGGTAAHAASFTGRAEIVALLLFRGADFKKANSVGLTARQEAKGGAIDVIDLFETEAGQESLKRKFPILKALKTEKKDKAAEKKPKKGIKILKKPPFLQEDPDLPKSSRIDLDPPILKSPLLRLHGTDTPAFQTRTVILTNGLMRCFTLKDVDTDATGPLESLRKGQLKEQHKLGGLIVCELSDDIAALLDALELKGHVPSGGHYFLLKNPSKEAKLWKNPTIFCSDNQELISRWVTELQLQNPHPCEDSDLEFKAMLEAFNLASIPSLDVPDMTFENIKPIPTVPFLNAPYTPKFISSPFYRLTDNIVWASPFEDPQPHLNTATRSPTLSQKAQKSPLLGDTLNLEADFVAVNNILAEIDTESDFLFSGDPESWGPDPSTWGLSAFADIHQIPFDNPTCPQIELYYCDSSFSCQDSCVSIEDVDLLRLTSSPFETNPTWEYPRELISQFEVTNMNLSLEDCENLFVFLEPPFPIKSTDQPIFQPNPRYVPLTRTHHTAPQEPTLHKIAAVPMAFEKAKSAPPMISQLSTELEPDDSNIFFFSK